MSVSKGTTSSAKPTMAAPRRNGLKKRSPSSKLILLRPMTVPGSNRVGLVRTWDGMSYPGQPLNIPAKALLICILKLPSEVVTSSPRGRKVCVYPGITRRTRVHRERASKRRTEISSRAPPDLYENHHRRAKQSRRVYVGAGEASTPGLLISAPFWHQGCAE